jgi:flotillin
MSGVVLVLIGTIAVVVLFLAMMISRLLYVSAPNQALIFSGGRRMVNGRNVGYRVIRGGRGLRMPLVEKVDSLDLTNIAIEIEVLGAFSKGGIPLNVHGIANVKLPGEEPLLNNAIERFLGRDVDYIRTIAKETLEGNLRGVLAQLTPEEVNEDKIRFGAQLVDEAEHDLSRMGLVLDTLKIQNVTDDAGYLNSIGRIRGATVRMTATVAEANTRADAEEQQARNWAASEVATIDTDLAIAEQETQKRIIDAKTRREAMIAEAQGQVSAAIEKIKAEIEQQKARALQVKRQLEADVVQPAEAERRAREEAARGQAATIIERGRAEAGALKSLVEAFRQAGPAAREVLALQKLMPLVNEISGARQKMKIGRVSVLPGGGEGDAIARTAIGASTRMEAAGMDLVAAARRVLSPASSDKK